MQRNTGFFSCSLGLYIQVRCLPFTHSQYAACRRQFVQWFSSKYRTTSPRFFWTLFVCLLFLFVLTLEWAGGGDTGITLGIKDDKHLAMSLKEKKNPKCQKHPLYLKLRNTMQTYQLQALCLDYPLGLFFRTAKQKCCVGDNTNQLR